MKNKVLCMLMAVLMMLTVCAGAAIAASNYTVRFNPDCKSYSGEMAAQDMVYGVSEKLNENAFSRVGFIFKGWATESGGKVVYENGAKVKNLSAKDGGVVDLYAVWTWYGNAVTPSAAPSVEPTEAPTEAPTEVPTEEPTEAPTEEPTEAPTEEPTEAPTEEPTEAPTEEPTEVPTEEPTEEPAKPTKKPVTEDDEEESIPKTGDNSLMAGMFVALAMMAATVVLAVCRIKARKEN